MYNILVAEDDEDIAELVRLYLTGEDYEACLAYDGKDAWKIFQQKEIHLAIIDIMMPEMNGYDLIKNIRSISNIPVIIVSAKNRNIDKIVGFNSGADMYLTKPFDPMELIAHVKAAIRRYYQLGGAEHTTSETSIYRHRDLTLDIKSMTARKDGIALSLTATEIRILALLIQSPGKLFTREQIAEHIRSDFVESDAKTIAVHISNLRKKLGDDSVNPQYIRSVRGLGYKIDKE